MRRSIPLVAAAVLLAGCGFFHKNLGVADSAPAHREPNTTSVFGDWVLDQPDSSAFAGARVVEMSLSPTAFAIRATYGSRPAESVSGTAALSNAGTLTLTAQSGSQSGTGRLTLPIGRPVTWLASAAGNTLVFAPPTSDLGTPEPSSVWHRKAAAQAAGKIAGDSTPRRP